MLIPPANSPAIQIPDYFLIPGRSPYPGVNDAQLHVSRVMLEDLEKQGPTRKFYDALLIPETVESPVVILEGLNRTGFENAYCYSRVPSCRWRDDQTKTAPPPWKVFLVYVVPINDDLYVLDWEWRFEHQGDSGYPKNWKSDYVRQVWPQIN